MIKRLLTVAAVVTTVFASIGTANAAYCSLMTNTAGDANYVTSSGYDTPRFEATSSSGTQGRLVIGANPAGQYLASGISWTAQNMGVTTNAGTATPTVTWGLTNTTPGFNGTEWFNGPPPYERLNTISNGYQINQAAMNVWAKFTWASGDTLQRNDWAQIVIRVRCPNGDINNTYYAYDVTIKATVDASSCTFTTGPAAGTLVLQSDGKTVSSYSSPAAVGIQYLGTPTVTVDQPTLLSSPAGLTGTPTLSLSAWDLNGYGTWTNSGTSATATFNSGNTTELKIGSKATWAAGLKRGYYKLGATVTCQ